ncbi:MAG: pantetheine-phosphate adenylyltransferase [Bacteriovoracaceae bacterium]|nr:pantetheine-phosphate adenylyltransferase [Bacteriovoracaceae bacterium]
MKKKALYAGSFDPFTNGHLDIVNRALSIFDEIYIVIAVSPSKKPFLERSVRRELLTELFKGDPRVKVDTWDGLLVDYARENEIKSIVRGLRPTGDFEFEFQMASMNRKLNPECETVFFATGEKLYYISSSLVKDVFTHGGDISEFVPDIVREELLKKRRS